MPVLPHRPPTAVGQQPQVIYFSQVDSTHLARNATFTKMIIMDYAKVFAAAILRLLKLLSSSLA